MRAIERIVIHCTATKAGKDYSVADIRRWHVEGRHFKDIGYHFLIHIDGTIERGRPWDQPGAHAKGYNRTSIGIAYVGGLEGDTRTTAQVHALRGIVGALRAMYPMIEVDGHRDLSVDLNGDGAISKNEWMKLCPQFDMKDL